MKTIKKMYNNVSVTVLKHRELKKIPEIISAQSYFAEENHKSIRQMQKENKDWVNLYSNANEFYKLYGLDVQGTDPSLFLDNREFIISRNQMCKLGEPVSQTVLLRDKFQFFKYMSGNEMPAPHVFCFLKNGVLYDSKFKTLNWDYLKDKRDYFIKDIDGECASYVKKISNYSILEMEKEKISDGTYILQERIVQNRIMDGLNPGAINTLRIVTVYNDGSPYVLSSLLRVGTSKTGNVDNWAVGGLAIGISRDGHLKDYGFYKPIHGTKTTFHPDTNIKFSSFVIPMYQEALKMACEAHKLFYNIETIGWDIAISESGPMFIEGNDNWEISLMQACDRPLKKEWREIVKRAQKKE